MWTGALKYAAAAVAAAPLIVAGAWWAQSGRAGSGVAECEARCLADPAAAASDCDCEAIAARRRSAGGSTRSLADVDPAEWRAERRRAEAERLAPVANYLIVETTNIAPMPIIAYYEKEPPVADEPPSFRRIDLPELLRSGWKSRAAQATSPDEKAGADLMANPGAFLGVLGAGLDELGKQPGTGIAPGGSEGLARLAEALRKVPADMKAQEEADAAEAAHQRARDAQIDRLLADLEQQADTGRMRLGYGLYYPDREPAAARFERRTERLSSRDDPPSQQPGSIGRIHLCRQSMHDCTPIPWDAMLCDVMITKGPIETDWDGRPLTITEVQEWDAVDPYFRGQSITNTTETVRVLLRVEGLESTGGGFRRFLLEREEDDFRETTPVPSAYRTRERMEAGGQASPEIVRTVKKVEVNKGRPTQAEITAMLVETFGQLVPGGGR